MDGAAPALALADIGHAILAHHERLDGGGYPKGLSGNDIGLYARIIAIAESYVAMTRPSAYRTAMSREDAIAELRRNEGAQFDPELTEVFIEKVLEGEG